MTTINSDVAQMTTDDADETGVDAFLARFLPKEDEKDEKDAQKEPSESKGDEENTEDNPQSEDDADESSDESPEGDEEESDDEDKAPEKKYVEDDDQTYVKIKVGDEEHEVPVKDLKRLHGQESALTKRSQAVAAEKRSLDETAAWHGAQLEALLGRAKARYEPFSKMDFFAIAADPNMKPEEKQALKEMAQTAYEEVRFLEQERGNFMKALETQQNTARTKAAEACVKELTDAASPHFIEGWGNKTYNSIREFAIEQGLDKEVVNGLVEAPAFKLLHMAMLYKQGQSKADVKTVKVNKTVKKVVKTSKTMPKQVRTGKGNPAEKAMAELKARGDTDATANAFLARWADSDSE